MNTDKPTDKPFDRLLDLDRPIEPPAEVDERVRALLVEAVRQPVRAANAPDTLVDISADDRQPRGRRRILAPTAAAAVAAAAVVVAVLIIGTKDGGEPTLVDDPAPIEAACGSTLEPYPAIYRSYFDRTAEGTATIEDLIGLVDGQSALLDRLESRDDLTAAQRTESAEIRAVIDRFDPNGREPEGVALVGLAHDRILRLFTSAAEPFGCVLPGLAWPPPSD